MNVMNTYTFTLVKFVPVIQTVTVEAEHSDDAFDLVTPDNDSWVPQPDVDYNDLPWEVQDVTPLDDDEDDEGDEDDEDDEGDEDEEVLEIAAIA